jgi:sugar diacid utilization regulator
VIGRVRVAENGRAFHGAAKLERLSDFFHRALSPLAFGRLIDIGKDEVLAILTAGAQTSKRVLAAFAAIAAELKTELNDMARIGISLDAAEISALPQGYQEAERAVEFANAGRPILHFADIDLMEFLVRRPDAAALRLIPDWAVRFVDADSGKSGELTRTINEFADCNFNVKRTARHLDLHTNTVYFRLNRIRELTGIDPRSYSGLSLLLTTVRMLNAGAREGAGRR